MPVERNESKSDRQSHEMDRILARGYGGETTALLVTAWPTHVISFRGARTDGHGWPTVHALIASGTFTTLELRLDDTSDPSDARAPTDKDVDAVIRFVEQMGPSDRLLTVCPGGYGRSAAAAIIAKVVDGLDPTRALEELLHDRPRATPNRLMICRADAILGLNGKLWNEYAAWARERLGLAYGPPVPLTMGPKRRGRWRRSR